MSGNSPEWMASYRSRHNGLTPAGVSYRAKHGIPLHKPVAGNGWKSGIGKVKEKEGKVNGCYIRNGRGRPERCIKCAIYYAPTYETCLDFALKNNWRGWTLC